MSSIFDRVPEICAWVAAAEIDVLVLTGPEGSLRLERAADGAVSRTDVRADEQDSHARGSDTTAIRAAIAGTFLARHPLREEPLAPPGAHVAAGQALGLIQIGDLLAPVCAPVAGVVDAILAEEGALVGYGEPLFALARD